MSILSGFTWVIMPQEKNKEKEMNKITFKINFLSIVNLRLKSM